MKNYIQFFSFFYVFLFSLLFSVLPINVQAQTDIGGGIIFSGDFRLRFENTSNQEPGATLLEGRNREVVRLRAGITKQISDFLTVGARIATGSSNDPNTADVTLGNFVNDLEISLDRLYIQLKGNNYSLLGGKFPNPFIRTDLVWDGDVNPQGLAGSYKIPVSKYFVPRLLAIYYIIDEHSGKDIPDSEMKGGQLQVASQVSDNLKLTLAGGYSDYKITNLSESTADAGDTRSNFIVVDSTGKPIGYVSDFDLLDITLLLEHTGFSEDFPIRFVGDYVKNLGAANDEDQGIMLDLFVGKASKQNDVRFRYGYSQTETDAVLAAFSNDNTTIATNYIQHTFTFDYVPINNVVLNLTWYVYKYNKVMSGVANEFISRLRLNAMVKI